MSTIAESKRFTPDDLLKMRDGPRYELVDGQLVERNMSMWSSYVAGQFHRRLSSLCHGKRLAWVLPPDASYQCFPDAPGKVRKPDVSLILLDRISVVQAQEEGHITVAPDFLGEVLSPNDNAYDVDERVHAYLRAGVRLIWIVNPRAHTVDVHRLHGRGTILRENDELSGEDVVPGFHCRVGELFVPPTEAASKAP